ncbi:uncharacterized protein LOC129298913 isoform X2 [Prosopis cineraria]|uniref:uncharacterized protein LOC129290357 isoform X2 n=1 Tax=Prosopis cineraria TaxID=364024 RepID=UPI0024109C70|nr:uncharacterized protein LOC129290357 isoform X2 [Prosopis cineraria]XP_054793331.1 uncharacterized protein LOC129298913 isoform X2 [Prosopis cineraria]
MATIASVASICAHLNSHHTLIFPSKSPGKTYRVRCNGGNPTTNSSTKKDPKPQNALLKIAWYSSELLGVAASVFRSPSIEEAPERTLELAGDGSGAVDRAAIVATIKEDFEKSYFVTGNLTLNAYEEDCEFADPAGSFKGLQRFKRNCTNFGSLLVKSSMKLMKWEDFEQRDIQNTILMHNLEEFADMWSTGMFRKWLYLGKF